MLDNDSNTKLPPGIDCQDIIAFGTTGLVTRYPNTLRVAKIPHGGDPDAQDRSSINSKIYQHLSQLQTRHSSILQYFGTLNGNIILEYAEKGDVRRFLRTRETPPQGILLQWAQQAAEALAFCHSQSVLHGDINCGNLCLDRHLNIKLSDFAGSSINGSLAKVCYSTSHQLPQDQPSTTAGIMISEKTEIFAFGSTLYEMAAGHEPYSEKDDSEIDLYRRNIFPDVTDLGPLGPVIMGCWTSEFDHMSEVVECIVAKSKAP